MAQKNKAKEGNGAKAQAQPSESPNQKSMTQSARPLARRTESEHPLSRLRDEIDSMFNRFFAQWPAPMDWGRGMERFWDVDLEETDKEILVRAEAPGFEPKDFDIHVSGDTLTIRAEHKQETEEKQGESRFWERRYGRFVRSIPLPAPVNAEKVDAHYRNGVLELRLPRTEETPRRRIEVKA
jgi:HSP20 family protein